MDVYSEVLKWQKEMQSKSVDEAQIVLNSNLEKIARVSFGKYFHRHNSRKCESIIPIRSGPNVMGSKHCYININIFTDKEMLVGFVLIL